jgi:hypothetical protein
MAAAVPFLAPISAGLSILSGVKSLLSSEPKTPKQVAPAPAPTAVVQAPVPEVTPPTVMPVKDDKATLEARRRSLIAQRERGGRASTILSEQDTFGNS